MFLQNLHSCSSHTARVSIKLSPQSSRNRRAEQPCPDGTQRRISSLAPSRGLIAQRDQGAPVLQEVECKRKHWPEESINREKSGESMSLKRRRVTRGSPLEKASELRASGDGADAADLCPDPEDSQVPRNRFRDVRYLDALEKCQLVERLQQAAALVVTLLYEDGSTQLGADPVSKQCRLLLSCLFVVLTPEKKAIFLASDFDRRARNTILSSQQRWILNPLSEARARTCILMDPGRVCYHRATTGAP